MRDYLLVYINGQEHRIRGQQAFMSLSDYLRYQKGLTGTKVVCSEGDCGACTILRGRLTPDGQQLHYESINSCIAFMHLMDCSHIITVEGLTEADGGLNPIQQAMLDCHGTQCGFCTPGFVCALTEFVNHRVCQSSEPQTERHLNEQQVRNALTGNLCRCTGYRPIIEAGQKIDLHTFEALQQRYASPEMHAKLRDHMQMGIFLEAEDKRYCAPLTFEEALSFKVAQPEARVFSSATDLGVLINKAKTAPTVITSLNQIPEAHQISEQDGWIEVGARVSLTQLENFCRTRIPEFARLMRIFASPQIKNKGTLVGNIANASPIADTLPFLFVAEAEIELLSAAGSRRVNINQFYTGYKQLAMQPDELISKVWIPVPAQTDILRLYKVSNRKDLDISTLTAAIRLELNGQRIQKARIAYGGVGPVVMRLPQTEALLAGSLLEAEVFEQAAQQVRQEITPISDVRASADYRYQVAENILRKFYAEFEETTQELELV